MGKSKRKRKQTNGHVNRHKANLAYHSRCLDAERTDPLPDSTVFWMLSTKILKGKHRQILHIKDIDDRTYCQTENVHRSKPLVFIKVDDRAGRRVCLICRSEALRAPDRLTDEYTAIMQDH